MSSRLSRQEIKRDEFVETLGGVWDFLRRNARALLIGALALVIAVVGAIVWVQVQASRERRASEELAETTRLLEAPLAGAETAAGDSDLPSFPSEEARAERVEGALVELRESFGGTDAADIAAVYLADLAAARGDLERARGLWQEFLERQGDHLLAVQVRVNRIAADRVLGRGEEVVAELEAMAESEEPELPMPLVLHQLATTLESLGRPAEAAPVYRRLADEHPGSPYTASAQRKAGQLSVAQGD